MHTVRHSKASAAWNLITAAAQMCQKLGYHRADIMRNQPNPPGSNKDVKAIVFWHVYTLEKALALRLGYSSTIQSFDVTISRDIDHTGLPGPWSGYLGCWIKISDIQSMAYELLYGTCLMPSPSD